MNTVILTDIIVRIDSNESHPINEYRIYSTKNKQFYF